MKKSSFFNPNSRTRSLLWTVVGLMLLVNLALLIFLASELGTFSFKAAPVPTAAPTPPRATPTTAPSPTPLPSPTAAPTPTFAPTVTLPPVDVDIEAILAGMSLEQKAGQKIMAVIPGETADKTAQDLIRGRQIGGIALYNVNVNNPEQTARLTQDLQALAAYSKPAVPLLIAIDHEGGDSYAFKQGVTRFPPQMAISASDSLDLAYRMFASSASELRAMGINVSFGPVLDVNYHPHNPVGGLRSFGDSPQRVADYGAAAVAGLLEGGVAPVVKHFPGHGDTNVDSHGAIPFIDRDLVWLQARELAPFQRTFQLQVPGVMVGHIANREIDAGGTPASLSRALNYGLLRDFMGYQGVIFTDSLFMAPIRRGYPTEDAALRAELAGSDILLYTNPAYALTAQQVLVAAVERGQITPQDLDASVRRILLMKARLGLFDPDPRELPAAALETHRALAEEIARRAIVLQGEPELPLLRSGRVMLFTPDSLDKGSTENDSRSLLGELLENRGLQVDEWIYPLYEPDKAVTMREEALAYLPGADAVIMVTFDGRMHRANRQNDSQERMAEALYRSGVPVILVAASTPYDLLMAPSGQPALATFGDTPVQLEMLVEALFSTDPPQGRLPVELK